MLLILIWQNLLKINFKKVHFNVNIQKIIFMKFSWERKLFQTTIPRCLESITAAKLRMR